MQSIAALKDVDFVTANISDTAIYPISNLKPDFYCKGKDYLDNKKSYVYAMMKELKWSRVESRIKKVEAMAKAG